MPVSDPSNLSGLALRAAAAVEVMGLNVLGLADVCRQDGTPVVLGLPRPEPTDTTTEPVYLRECYCAEGGDDDNLGRDVEFRKIMGHMPICCEALPPWERDRTAAQEVVSRMIALGLEEALSREIAGDLCVVTNNTAHGVRIGLRVTAGVICQCALSVIRQRAAEGDGT